MGIQINGSTDTISAVDGSLSIEGGELRTVSGINVAGVVTATSYQGDGSALTGIAATANVRTGILDVAGVGTFRSDVNVPDSIIHLGDTDTKIRFPAADTVTFETGGSERARIDSSGRLLVGTTSAVNVGGYADIQSYVQASVASAAIISTANSSAGGRIQLAKSRGGTSTIVSSGDELGLLGFAGADGTDLNTLAAYILCSVDGTPGANDMPGRLVFATTADGASSPSERMRITSAGFMGLGVTDPAEELEVSGSGGCRIALNRSGNDGYAYLGTGTTNDLQFGYDGSGSLEYARFDSSGRLLQGHTSAITNLKFGGSGDFGSRAYIIGGNQGFSNGLAILNYDATNNLPAILKLASSRSDTPGTNTVVGSSNDTCVSIQMMGNDGTRFIDLARIDAVTDGTPGTNDMPGRLSFLTTSDGASVVTERMRLTKGGHLYVHNDVQYSSSYTQMPYTGDDNVTLGVRFNTNVSGKQYGVEIQNTAGVVNSYAMIFSNGTTRVGHIIMGTSSTTYSTTSDYRLKENVVNLDGAINRVKQLSPKRFNFTIDPGNTVDGFLAHEVQSIVPEAISGVKDELRVWQEGEELPDGVSVGDNKLDEDGNTIPEYQGIDQSKLVPLLTAALQEAIGKIEALETANASQAATIAALDARLTALEGGN